MPKNIAQNVAQQVKQIGEETLEKLAKQPGELAGKVLEQMGVTSGKTPAAPQKPTADEQKANIAQMDKEDKERVSPRIVEIQAEIKELQQIRDEQLRKRREIDEQAKARIELDQAEVSPLAQPPAKKKRGLFGMGRGRLETAQEQAAPEKSGRRVGG